MEKQKNKFLRQKDIPNLRNLWLKNLKEDILFRTPIDKPTLDHDHITGRCRGVLDYNSNQIVGKIESAWKRFGYKHKREDLPAFLRRVSRYLEQDYSSTPIHPKHIQIQIKKFSRLPIQKQINILKEHNLKDGKTKKDNTLIYRRFLFREENVYKV